VDVEALLCDLDGVLVDSTAAVLRCWRRLADRHGVDHALVETTIHGRPARESIELLLPEADIEAEAALLADWELADLDGVRALPGAMQLRDRWPEERFAIVTSCVAPLAHARLGAAGIAPPPALVTADRVSRGKPDPECYLLAAWELGVPPERCLAVEDAPAGLAAARAAGVPTAAVTTTHAASQLEADLVVGTVADLLPLVA
jgi:mannitol-1-/sugar-/sorbitol-6-phosphatase